MKKQKPVKTEAAATSGGGEVDVSSREGPLLRRSPTIFRGLISVNCLLLMLRGSMIFFMKGEGRGWCLKIFSKGLLRKI